LKARVPDHMKATQLLIVDHEEAKTMIAALVSRGDANENLDGAVAASFTRIKEALKLHAEVEESVFYPALRSFSELKHVVGESYLEHREIDRLLVRMKPGGLLWDEQITELRRKFQDHADEEEQKLFPQAERLLGDSELMRIGREIQALKADALANGL
jgi:hemerythrin superfamily protein